MGILDKMMLSCKKAADLTEQKMNVGLGLTDYLKLTMHVRACMVCKEYKVQQQWIHEFLHKSKKTDIDLVKAEQLKNRILGEIANR